MSNGKFLQSRLENARFLVVGCGALGNEVLKNLVLLGARHITIVDFDSIEEGNLSRSVLFRRSDVGKKKVVAMSERLREINPQLDITAIDGDYTTTVGAGWTQQANVVVGCVDNRWARYCINRTCMRLGKPWVDGGIAYLEGTARVFVPGVNCYACNLDKKELNELHRRASCADRVRYDITHHHAPTTSITASVIGATEAQEAVKLVHQEAIKAKDFASLCGKMFYYDGEQLSTRVVDFKAWDRDCPVHEQWTTIEQTDIDTSWTVGDTLNFLYKKTLTDRLRIDISERPFVDYIEERTTRETFEPLLPAYKVAQYIKQNLKDGEYLQHEIKVINTFFPYMDMTLGSLGIPTRDILHAATNDRDYYFEIR